MDTFGILFSAPNLISVICYQITDIHISKYRDLKRANDLQQFCYENIDVIRPVVVLATGKVLLHILLFIVR